VRRESVDKRINEDIGADLKLLKEQEENTIQQYYEEQYQSQKIISRRKIYDDCTCEVGDTGDEIICENCQKRFQSVCEFCKQPHQHEKNCPIISKDCISWLIRHGEEIKNE